MQLELFTAPAPAAEPSTLPPADTRPMRHRQQLVRRMLAARVHHADVAWWRRRKDLHAKRPADVTKA